MEYRDMYWQTFKFNFGESRKFRHSSTHRNWHLDFGIRNFEKLTVNLLVSARYILQTDFGIYLILISISLVFYFTINSSKTLMKNSSLPWFMFRLSIANCYSFRNLSLMYPLVVAGQLQQPHPSLSSCLAIDVQSGCYSSRLSGFLFSCQICNSNGKSPVQVAYEDWDLIYGLQGI